MKKERIYQKEYVTMEEVKAKQYRSMGTYNVTVTWSKGERLNDKEALQ